MTADRQQAYLCGLDVVIRGWIVSVCVNGSARSSVLARPLGRVSSVVLIVCRVPQLLSAFLVFVCCVVPDVSAASTALLPA